MNQFIAERAESKLGIIVAQGFGMTEASPMVFHHDRVLYIFFKTLFFIVIYRLCIILLLLLS
jgi:hypothetical protein